MRYRFGAPWHAPGTSAIQGKIANITHWSLYGLLLAMCVSGMLAFNGFAALGQAHFIIGVAIFFLALPHALAALFNQFVRKDGTMNRMMLSRKT